MKVLVTGGGGFVGSHLVEYYARKNYAVVAFDNLSRASTLDKVIGNTCHTWKLLKNNYADVELVNGDVRNFQAVRDSLKGVDAVIHTAAQVAVTTSLANPRADFETNALGTFNVLEASRLNDVDIVFCSTNKVYGSNVNSIPITCGAKRYSFADEEYLDGIPEGFPTDLCEHSPYGCSKLAADTYVQEYAHTYGLRAGVFRMSCVYGERQFGVEDQGWLAWFVLATLTSRQITIFGDGKQVRDVLYISDLVRALDLFLSSNIRSEVFNIGGGPTNTLSILELLDLIEEFVGSRPNISFSDWRPADQKVYVSNISRARKMLKWEPIIGPREGVKRLVRWFTENIELFR
ncbi:NAD-dependent epimerase/dehydratase family protein [Candidatus Bathyarchaeota archaeon]|nr:NAD-dependent epimerase/dehydratase family protein [Candidatus Bathyarchaeota archaeon]